MKTKNLNKIPRIRLRFQISLLVLILFILGISTVTTIAAVLSINRNVSRQKAEQLFTETGISIRMKLDNQLEKAIGLSGLITTLPDFTAQVEEDGFNYPGLPFLFEALKRNSYIYSIYTGFDDGRFIQLINTSGNSLIIDAHNAPESTTFILRAISFTDSVLKENWSFLDLNRKLISSHTAESVSFIPGERPWYQMAERSDGVILTEPYVYNSLKKPGITAAAAISETAVSGVDITLSELELFLDSIEISEGAGIMVLDESDRILAADSGMKSWLDVENISLESITALDPVKSSYLMQTEPGEDDKKAVKRLAGKRFLINTVWDTPGEQRYRLIITAPASDFLAHQEIIQRRIIIITVIIFILVFPIIIITSIYLSRFLEYLAADAERIQHFIFDGSIKEHSPIIEFEELAKAFVVMKKAIAAKTRALEETLKKLERIIELGTAMSVEKDPDKLVEMILKGAKELSGADGGSLYLKGQNKELDFKIVLNDSLGFAQGGASHSPITMPPVQLYQDDGAPNYHNVVSCTFHKAETIVIDDAYEDPDFDFSGTKKFDALNNYRSTSFMTVPLKLQGSDIIGALQLINCISPKTGEVVPFNSNIQSFVEALGALASAILYNRILLDSQDALFESLIHLTASAIDTKSPYTGGHCERVPQLALMLAEEAERIDEGPLAEFRFDNSIERKAFTVGAWLHDAGKMTTPEFIVDKAVKLETIHNRIHEIRTRFEVLLRDARLQEKEALLNGSDPEETTKKLKETEEQLHREFKFIADCNIGKEQFSPESSAELERIGERTWESHFDHTIGLSREESEKLSTPFIPGETVTEKLLADKAVHLFANNPLLNEKYRKHGFKLPQPDYLYNRGELYNLKIPSGTLTEEERFKINEHIMQTIIMLEELPFPSGMTRIPEIVGTHHETLTGTGYPRGLEASELSIPSRILTIADIFEALTASDRPYKEAKTLSEAVEILYQSSKSGNLDIDLFRLFISSGIYKRYAEKFLPSAQIDDVDEYKYLNKD